MFKKKGRKKEKAPKLSSQKKKPVKVKRHSAPSSLESPLVIKVKLRKREAARAKPGFVHPHSEAVIHPPEEIYPRSTGEGLPYSYGVTKIVLMVRDPYWCYAYWDFNPETLRKIEKWYRELPGPRAILRVYDVTDQVFDGNNANSFFDVDINFDSRNWYLEVGKPGRDFIVDIGIRDAQGRFYLITRSNAVRIPRDTPSDVIDEEWMSKDFELFYAISGGLKVGSSSAELVDKVKKGILFRQWLSSGAVSSR